MNASEREQVERCSEVSEAGESHEGRERKRPAARWYQAVIPFQGKGYCRHDEVLFCVWCGECM